eukprot:Mrub_10960.p1 GENE.Mrub_10960~~Mrub_10960.p1  ORF type:complete len:177 (-),score=16.15 Mrub_10960:114-644(-)
MVYIMVLILDNDEKSLRIILSEDIQVQYMLIKIEDLDHVINLYLTNNLFDFIKELSYLMRGISFNKNISKIYEKLFQDIKSMLIKRMIQASTRVKFEYIRNTLEVDNNQIINEVSENLRGGRYYLDMIEQVVIYEEKGDTQIEEYLEVTKKVKKKLDIIDYITLDNKIVKTMNSMD